MVGRHDLVQLPAEHFFLFVAEHALRGRVPVLDAALRVHHDHRVERRRARQAQQLLVVGKALLGALALFQFDLQM